MTFRVRIAAGFAAVALATAAAVAIATPHIVSQGFTELEQELGREPTDAPSPVTLATDSPTGTAGAALPTPDEGPAEVETDEQDAGEGPGTGIVVPILRTTQPFGATATPEPGSSEHPTPNATREGGFASPEPRSSPTIEAGPVTSPEPRPSATATPDGAAGRTSTTPQPGAAPASEGTAAPGLFGTTRAEAPAVLVSESDSPDATESESPDVEARERAMATAVADVQQNTTFNVIAVALGAALIASLAGFLIARQVTLPLSRLEAAAAAVARGELGRRSGLANRNDEFGRLGKTFDGMASELERAEEARRRFLQDAAHELRTPLTVIDATASAILDGVYPPERRHIDTIRDQSRVLARIVDDLRTISLAEVGNLPLSRSVFAVRGLLDSVATAFAARAATRSVSVVVDAVDSPMRVDADEERLRQILGALVDNALRYTPAGGTITLRARLVAGPVREPADTPPPDPTPASRFRRRNRAETAAAAAAASARQIYVRIDVEDTGEGFPPEVLPRVFERFYQGDASHSRRSGTSGLGLSIVRALVEAHGGTLGAENVSDSGGGRVWFALPAA